MILVGGVLIGGYRLYCFVNVSVFKRSELERWPEPGGIPAHRVARHSAPRESDLFAVANLTESAAR